MASVALFYSVGIKSQAPDDSLKCHYIINKKNLRDRDQVTLIHTFCPN